MAEYTLPITKRIDNLLFMEDGTVWANYLLTGINTNPYKADKITGCQQSNERLFNQLSQLPATEFKIRAFKAKTPPQVVADRYVAGIPNFGAQPCPYPDLMEQVNAFYKQVIADPEYQRIYWLSIGIPAPRRGVDSLLSKVAVVDPHRKVSSRRVRLLEQRYFQSIPSEFRPIKTTPDDVRWIYDRSRQIGIDVPEIPMDYYTRMETRLGRSTEGMPTPGVRMAVDGPKTFAQIDINKNADGEALFDKFVEKVREELKEDPTSVDAYKRRWLDNFPATREGRAMSVANSETRNKHFPCGYTSYQSHLLIPRYPQTLSWGINTFTYLVDQEIGVDGDFTLHFDFNQRLISKAAMREVMKDLNSEDSANTRDELDSEDYAERRSEARNWRVAVKSETAPRGIRVATTFTFGSQNLEYLNDKVDELYQKFIDNDFTPMLPVGGQDDLWKATMPGGPATDLIEDAKQVSTTKLFSGAMPIRRTDAGDGVGIPVFRIKENALGQYVHWDLINATDKPSGGSTGLVAAKGGGKSQHIKYRLGKAWALNLYAHAIDLSKEGELVVYAKGALARPGVKNDPEIIDVLKGDISLDLLKVLPPDVAAQVFPDVWLPLVGFSSISDEADILATVLDPVYRETLQIDSTRALIDHLPLFKGGGVAAANLANALSSWGRRPYAKAFIDPPGQKKAPGFNSEAHMVIFWCRGLQFYRGSDFEKNATDSQRFAAMAFTAIAEITAWRFAKIRDICVFAADELHYQKGSSVQTRLIGDYDRVGRRDRNIMLVGSQLGDDMENTDLVQEKFMGRQGTQKNAVKAFTWGDTPPTQRNVDRMIEETSPPDPDRGNRPRIGTEGQGWYNDGNGNIVWGQLLDHELAKHRKYSDTTSSRLIRAEDLDDTQDGEQAPRHSVPDLAEY